ncbi:efflux RND transporter periplasmic adaptor subunit [Aliamphritea ceti]|uniref:efflux RND transporter periplasmic adaptor subunit n=1 Tax=Aliamphritea ceti TaxID=1524258 RepID=UPI0021C2FE28|nr:HlyD family efflux transporter periplasmic adaptor subunit [Aliamphritea ceti]
MSIHMLAEPQAVHQGISEDNSSTPSDVATLTVDQKQKVNIEAVTGLPSLSADLAQTWLAWQCKMVAGLISGAIYLPADIENKTSALTVWPLNSAEEPQLIEIAARALADRSGVLRAQQQYGPSNNRSCDLIACPLLVDSEPVGIVSVMISTRSESQQNAVLQLLQWGSLWMETLIYQQCASRREYGAFSLSLMTAVVACPDDRSAAVVVANQLADQFGCERVSIGFRQGLQIRLQAISNINQFDSRTQLVRRIEAAMEEASDQNMLISQPVGSSAEPAITRAHAELSSRQDNGAVCTLPLTGQYGAVGAITLEKGNNQPFDNDVLVLCESLGRLLGPFLEQKIREHRSFWAKGAGALMEGIASIFGPTRLKLKLVLLASAALISGLSVTNGTYLVTAPASIQGTVRHLLAAPLDGYVKQALVRAGDLVQKGELIASLDDRKLQLEHQKWQNEGIKLEKEYQEALAKRERIRLSVLRAQLDQVAAELQLVEERIKRTQLFAPVEGIVVSGDLSQSLGTPVKTGQVLYEVAPLNDYRVVLEVDEQKVSGLTSGKAGKLIVNALPSASFDVVIEQVGPVAISSDKRNYFRIEASLDKTGSASDSHLLLPGMQGVAKVDMGQRNLLWIWTHSFIDRVRLWVWYLGW